MNSLIRCLPRNFLNNQTPNLTWEDFQGPPEENSSFDACLKWGIYYNYKFNESGLFKLDVQVVSHKSSWYKKGKENQNLLTHENGHFAIALIYGNILKECMSNLLTKHNDYSQINENFNKLFQECVDLQELYDKETDHGLNEQVQKNWNNLLGINFYL